MKSKEWNLYINMEGDDVSSLQQALRELGLDIDKNEWKKRRFGKSTIRAIKMFQKEHNLEPTGEVNETTANLINDTLALKPNISKDLKTLVISGQVIDRASRKGLAGLRVEAWDKDLFIDDQHGSAKTDENGRFTLSFNKSFYQDTYSNRKPNIYFKVFFDDNKICSTKDRINWNFDNTDEEITIEIYFKELKSTLVEDIKALQRIAFIAPDLDTSFELLNKGIRSANQIAALPEQTFISSYGSCFANTLEAKKSYNKAVMIVSSSKY